MAVAIGLDGRDASLELFEGQMSGLIDTHRPKSVRDVGGAGGKPDNFGLDMGRRIAGDSATGSGTHVDKRNPRSVVLLRDNDSLAVACNRQDARGSQQPVVQADEPLVGKIVEMAFDRQPDGSIAAGVVNYGKE